MEKDNSAARKIKICVTLKMSQRERKKFKDQRISTKLEKHKVAKKRKKETSSSHTLRNRFLEFPRLAPWLTSLSHIFFFRPFYWAGFFAQRERAQQDFKVPLQGAPPHPPPLQFTYERQPLHRDHPTLIRIVRGFFNVPQNYQHSK